MLFCCCASNETIGAFWKKSEQTTILSYFVSHKLSIQIKWYYHYIFYHEKNQLIIVNNNYIFSLFNINDRKYRLSQVQVTIYCNFLPKIKCKKNNEYISSIRIERFLHSVVYHNTKWAQIVDLYIFDWQLRSQLAPSKRQI